MIGVPSTQAPAAVQAAIQAKESCEARRAAGLSCLSSPYLQTGTAQAIEFDRRAYAGMTDCLNAASAAHVPLNACGNGRGR
ncbi:MAG: hypothetical protein J0H44_11800 [Alphaproteobacteria bacterium]|nr:hypothetical protein [Alphaproteobacteria bacterium]